MSTITSKYTLTKGDTFGVSSAPTTDLTTSPAYTALSDLIKQVQWQQGARSDIDVTTFASPDPEYVPGIRAQDGMTLTGNWVESHAGATLLRDSYTNAVMYAFKLAHADAITPGTGTGSFVEVIGYVSQIQISDALNGIRTATINLKLTGAPKFTAAT